MHLWDIILPQAVITFNMLRTSRINPKLSAATHIFGQYDFNRAPLAPPGTMIIAHETPGRRRTWAPHGQDGWYSGHHWHITDAIQFTLRYLDPSE
jgi:hypothetical protein